MTHSDSASDVEVLLEQAAAFAWHGDFIEARARVVCARQALGPRAGDKARGDVARALERCNALLDDWQEENAERSATYSARERKAIGGDGPAPPDGVRGWARAVEVVFSALSL